VSSHSEHIISGWNDVVKYKQTATAAFLDRVAAGQSQNQPVFLLMSQTRAAFKLALCYCRKNEEMMHANAYTKSMACKDFKSFWNGINKLNNAKVKNMHQSSMDTVVKMVFV